MVQVMTATFILSYVPFFTVFVLSIFGELTVPQVVNFGCFWMLIANSFFNSVIYVTMNTAYRRRMGEMFDSVLARFSRLRSLEGNDSRLSASNIVEVKSLPDSGQKASTSWTDVRAHCQDVSL